MESPKFPREEGFRYFLHTTGRRYANPYPHGEADHALFEAGWRQAALICGQAHLAEMSLGIVAENLPVVSRHRGRAAGASLPEVAVAAGVRVDGGAQAASRPSH